MLRSFLLIVLATLFGLTAVGAEITFRESATPSRGGLVRLGDVAEVRGADSRRLSDLPLMPRPAPGEGQLVSAQAVREMLAAQGEAPTAHRFGGSYFVRVASPGENASLAGPTTSGWRTATPVPAPTRSSAFRVRTGVAAASPVTPRRDPAPRRLTNREVKSIETFVTDAVQDAIDEQSPTDPEAPRLAVREVKVSASAVRDLLQMMDQPIEVRFAASEPLAPGKTSVRVWPASRSEDEAFRVVADLVGLPMRVVAATAMPRDSMLVASVVRLEPTPLEEIDRPQAVGYTRIDQVVGREAKRPLRPGDVLSDANTAPPLMVERGEEVTVSSGGGGVSVRVRAVAQQAGRQGDLVTVQTLDTAEKFMARVVGERRLAILSAGPLVGGSTRTGGLR